MRKTRKHIRARRKRSRRARQYKSRGGSNEKIKVIGIPWEGLGDHLMISTLPEMYSKNGYTVYISDKQIYRSNEIYDLVWKLNPFIKGKSSLPGSTRVIDKGDASKAIDPNFIKNIELANDVTNGYRKYPVIYYTPKRIEAIADYLIADSSAVSSNPTNADYSKSFRSIYDKYPNLKPHILTFKVKGYSGFKEHKPQNATIPTYEIENMFHLCDVIFTCKVFVSGFSGVVSLASAIKQDLPTPEIFSFHSADMVPSNTSFKMLNVTYLPVLT